MPWETKFNIDDAISQAADVFWAKGYKSTSLSDLLDAMEINKGSFYNTFGSKKELYTKTIDKYVREFKSDIIDHLMTFDDPVLSISTFFDLIIESSCRDQQKKGCFVFNIATDLPNQDPDTIGTIKVCINNITNFIKEQLEKGIAMNTINKEIDSLSTSKTLLALAISIRVLSRGVMNEEELISIKEQALKLIK